MASRMPIPNTTEAGAGAAVAVDTGAAEEATAAAATVVEAVASHRGILHLNLLNQKKTLALQEDVKGCGGCRS